MCFSPAMQPGAKTRMIAKVDRNIDRIEDRVDQPVVKRPWWQRIILPFTGLIMVLAGVVFLFSPVPLAILAVIGFPLLFCFHPRIERWSRERMVGGLHWVKRGLSRLRR